ncbi:MAG: hydantoinase B/oxoprolinase family protein [Phycisphaerales bacterium]
MAPDRSTVLPWQIWIETGGTFTDCLARSPEGRIAHAKVLSSGRLRARVVRSLSDRVVLRGGVEQAAGLVAGCTLRRLAVEDPPVRITVDHSDGAEVTLALEREVHWPAGVPVEVFFGEDAPLVAARIVTRTPRLRELPRAELRLATTRGTNALLTRAGARVALLITRGFGDLLRIGDQSRPEIFALGIRRAEPLYETVVEVSGRMDFIGAEIEPLDLDEVRRNARELVARGVRVAAVALLHSVANPAHEEQVADVLLSEGFTHVSRSSVLSGAPGLLVRSRTAVLNAFLAPEIGRYLGGMVSSLGAGSSLHVMTSAGGLVHPAHFAPKDSLLSGPASGVVGAGQAAADSGCSPVITFDMGGTSTDVSRFDRACELVSEHRVNGVLLSAAAVAVESIAAGGGSICWIDERFAGGLAVGPASAGADPGPACYGAGGPLTVTDCNLLLGRLEPSAFGIPIVPEAALARAEELLERLRVVRGDAAVTRAGMLAELTDLADEAMAGAIRKISVQRGYDPTAHTLVAFGGAAGQHACGVAERLGMTRVLVPADVGLLSAAGLSWARVERHASRTLLLRLTGADHQLPGAVWELARQAVREAKRDAGEARVTRLLFDVRLLGQDACFTIEAPVDEPIPTEAVLRARFAERFLHEYGYTPPLREIEVVSVRVVASGPRSSGPGRREPSAGAGDGAIARARLGPGARVDGPAIIAEEHGATFVRPGWRAGVDEAGALMLTRAGPIDSGGPRASEIIVGRLYAIATEMGETLRRASLSPNIKERLDFSCAVLDEEGRLIVNAPHLPVHLGAMGVTVRALREALPMKPGDVVLTNHPAFGGSHLPDVTVVSPVFDANGNILAFLANRAHHAEIGGVTPGSMPPGAASLVEEGVVIPPMYLVRDEVSNEGQIEALLRTAPYPSRSPEENLADLSAQVAANRRGAEALSALAAADGGAALRGAMRSVRERSRGTLLAALAPLRGRRMSASEHLDDGAEIRVALTVGEQGVVVDFGGSGPVHPSSFNAPAGVVRSAVMYALRLLIAEPLPLNEGLMEAVDLRVPEGLLNPPFDRDPARCPAVCAGNVETSQRVVDTLLKALGLAACSQGTMNNVIFGNDRFGCYETICGGEGAGPGYRGESAVHTHMTNTRITDPEILERRFPVCLRRFEVRRDSGGQGEFPGGDGAVREYEFLEPVTLSVLAQHRTQGPYGASGGEAGLAGAQRLLMPGGTAKNLSGVAREQLPARSRLIIETPGGGGWGAL